MTGSPASLGAEIVGMLRARHQRIAVAESFTGGLLVSELIGAPGASAVVLGGVVAYETELKQTLLGVDAQLLAEHGAVHPDVAAQMAAGVRVHLAVANEPADIGISTTGVAGPTEQDGQPVGTVFLGFAIGPDVHTTRIELSGSRDEIRAAAVRESLSMLASLLHQTARE